MAACSLTTARLLGLAVCKHGPSQMMTVSALRFERCSTSACARAASQAAGGAAMTSRQRASHTACGPLRQAPLGRAPVSRLLSSRQGAAGSRCGVYKDPEVYDIAFNFRDFEKETAHLLAMYQRHCQGPMQHFLEVASGPARHATAIAAATGAAATALDSSPDMLAYAAQLADAAGAGSRLTTLQADMAAAGWASQLAATADLAAVLLGSLAHCQDNGAALACFQELGAAVRPGGLLVLELPHPAELWGGYCLDDEQYVEAWDAQSEDGSKTVLVEWGREGDEFDCSQQVLHRTVGLSLYEGDELKSSVVEKVPQRQFTLQEIDLLARAAGFQVLEAHGDFDAAVGLDHEEAYRAVACLRRL